jgi:Fe2+ transport system protein FeoA
MFLSELKPGENGVVIEFNNFSDEVINRLNVMGINVGSNIHIDPSVVNLKHNQCFICDDIEFCLRYDDTKNIKIEKV